MSHSQKVAKISIFGIFSEFLATKNVNGVRFARNDFFCDFQTLLFLSLQARIQSRNEYGFSAESVLDLFQTFDIREASTQATTDLFQKIGERQNTYYQDAPTTKKDLHVINSEPLSTNSEKGDKK